uniref:Uncharacterized protein n=1 Tax=Panagrolaimus sp. ES5 TaxID=591445 RepID=A0AC34F559_9BILA
MDYNVTEQHSDTEMKETDQENNQSSTIDHENVGTPELETSIASHGTENVSPDREYFFGHDKLHGGRMWIQTHNDPTKYNLYALYNQNNNEDLYKCIQCTRYEHRGHKPSTIIVRHLSDGKMELNEKRNHYPSCSHDKSFIDKIQKKYHRTPRSNPNGIPKVKTPLQKVSTPRPALQSQASPNVSNGEGPRKRRSARLSQNEYAVFVHAPVAAPAVTPAATPPVVSRPFFIRPSSAAPSSARQRSRTQGIPHAPLQNARVVRDDSVASNFSHLIPSFRPNVNPSPLSRPMVAFSRASPIVVPLKTIDSAASSSTIRILTPPQVYIPTPPPIRSISNKSIEISGMQYLKPKILAANESFCHCIPSSHTFREMSALLGLEYKTHNQVFWHSTYMINEVTGRSKTGISHTIPMQRNLGFQALSLFLTSSDDSTFKIQESIKQYIFKNLHNLVGKRDETYNALLQIALCSYQLENIHLWVLTKIMNVRIAVFSGESVHVFGDVFNDSLPSILLKKENDEYLAVVSVKK